MRVAPWKVMLALAGLLVIVGILASLDIAGPGEVARILVFAVSFVFLTYAGYRFGNYLGERRSEGD